SHEDNSLPPPQSPAIRLQLLISKSDRSRNDRLRVASNCWRTAQQRRWSHEALPIPSATDQPNRQSRPSATLSSDPVPRTQTTPVAPRANRPRPAASAYNDASAAPAAESVGPNRVPAPR